MDPRILAQPPPPPPQTQNPPLPTQPPRSQSSAVFTPSTQAIANTPAGPIRSFNGRFAAPTTATAPSSLQPAQTTRYSDSFGQHQPQHMLSQERVFSSDATRVSQVSPGQSQSIHVDSGLSQGLGLDSNSTGPSGGAFHFTDHGYSGSFSQRASVSSSSPAAKPHPLQHLVDIHNAGPVSAFSHDPATFTGDTSFIHCIPF